MPVTVFEKSETIGGVCSQIVPEFRISMESVQKDVQLAEFMGAEFRTGQEAPSLAELKTKAIRMLFMPLVHGNMGSFV